jgi:hypothetical protein
MTEIRLGEVGFLQQGDEQGKYVLIQEDQRTGGYRIFYALNPDFLGGVEGQVFDYWVEDMNRLRTLVRA